MFDRVCLKQTVRDLYNLAEGIWDTVVIASYSLGGFVTVDKPY